jgi:release factor glutamine methyltransferase
MIVSNPPYVPAVARDTLQPEVRDYEPPTALFAGDDGLGVIRPLIGAAAARLVPRGWLLFEFGWGQAAAVESLLRAGGGWSEIELVPDLQGIPRVAVARRRSSPAIVPSEGGTLSPEP